MKSNPKPGPGNASPFTIVFYPSVADIPLRFSATVFDDMTKQDTDEYINSEFDFVFRVPVNGAARINGAVVSMSNKNYTLRIVYHKPKR